MRAGTIVLVDWRGDGLPKEANKTRPAVVVDAEFWPEEYPNVLVVPCSTSAELVGEGLVVALPRTETNGLDHDSFALSPLVTSCSKQRLVREIGHVTFDQLKTIRAQIALALC